MQPPILSASFFCRGRVGLPRDWPHNFKTIGIKCGAENSPSMVLYFASWLQGFESQAGRLHPTPQRDLPTECGQLASRLHTRHSQVRRWQVCTGIEWPHFQHHCIYQWGLFLHKSGRDHVPDLDKFAKNYPLTNITVRTNQLNRSIGVGRDRPHTYIHI